MGRGSGRHVGIWRTLKGVNHIRELDSITNEKNGKIVPNQIVVTILGIELDGKAAGVSDRICRASTSSDGGEANEHWGLFLRILNEFRLGVRLHALVNLEVAVCPCSFGMDNPLGDTFPVKMSHLLNKLNIL